MAAPWRPSCGCQATMAARCGVAIVVRPWPPDRGAGCGIGIACGSKPVSIPSARPASTAAHAALAGTQRWQGGDLGVRVATLPRPLATPLHPGRRTPARSACRAPRAPNRVIDRIQDLRILADNGLDHQKRSRRLPCSPVTLAAVRHRARALPRSSRDSTAVRPRECLQMPQQTASPGQLRCRAVESVRMQCGPPSP